MNCIIIDDQADSRKTLRNFLTLFCPQINIMAEANGVESAKRTIEQNNPSLIFLDVEMEDGTAFDLLNQLESIDFMIIFVTAHDMYSLKAIKLSAIDYLLKPVNPDELIVAVEKAEKNLRLHTIEEQVALLTRKKITAQSKIALPTANGVHFIKIHDIVRCEADNTYTIFSLINSKQKIVVSKPIKEYDELFCEYNFFRVHKSHLINLDHVIELKQGEILTLANSETVPVARTRKESFLKAINI